MSPPSGRRRVALDTPTGPPQPPALVSTSLATIEQAIGGRLALVAALAHAPKSGDLTYILGKLGDPARAHTPLATLCAEGGITPGELIEAYKQGEIARAQARALYKVGEKLDAVAEDTMRLALPHDITCPECHGTGSTTPEPSKKVPNPEPGPCDGCGGSGTVGLQGDLEHKKLALDMGKLLQKSGGINISQQVAVLGGTAGGALEQLQAATDAILFGDGIAPPDAVVEVEAVKAVEMPAEAPAVLEGDWREAAR